MKSETVKHSNKLRSETTKSQLIDGRLAHAIIKAHGLRLSYALCFFPGEETGHFFAATNPVLSSNALSPQEFDKFNGFVFNMFEVSDTLHAFGIRPELTAEDVININVNSVAPQRRCRAIFSYTSTDPMVYNAQARKIIKSFTSDNEKTVLSRIAHRSSTEADLISVANEYFAMHPGCFRFVYYTPESGVWMGASPELILDYDAQTCELLTMSLAGTRYKSDMDDWDDKNCMEHDMVTEFIVNTLNRFCTHVDQPRSQSVTFGAIEHLCHTISASGKISLSKLLPELTPTPALCGFPREKAYRQILATEAHRRLCYGGFIGVKDGNRTRLFANLRSAMVNISTDDPFGTMYSYNMFGGGGLTRYSDPISEMGETALKMSSLIQIIETSYKI